MRRGGAEPCILHYFSHYSDNHIFRATTTTPTNTNSTRATPLSLRKRSPSPVVTGNVSRARMRFESGGSIKNNKTSTSPVPLGFEPLSSQHQTLPRTFRFINNNFNSSLESKTTINKILSGSSYANSILVNILI